MPRPHEPTELPVLTGAYRPDRHGRRRGAPAGVLTSADRLALAMLACEPAP